MTPARAEALVSDADRRARRLIATLAAACASTSYTAAWASAREARRMERAWGRVAERWLAEYKFLAGGMGSFPVATREAATNAERAWARSQDWAAQGDRYEERTRP